MALSLNDAGAQPYMTRAAYGKMDAADFARRFTRKEYDVRDAEDLARIDEAISKLQAKKGTPLTEEDIPALIDAVADIRIEEIALERLKRPRGEGTSFEDTLLEFGLTEEDLEGWEDAEIE